MNQWTLCFYWKGK